MAELASDEDAWRVLSAYTDEDLEDEEEPEEEHPGYGSLLGMGVRTQKKKAVLEIDPEIAEKAAQVMELNASQLLTNPGKTPGSFETLGLDPFDAAEEIDDDDFEEEDESLSAWAGSAPAESAEPEPVFEDQPVEEEPTEAPYEQAAEPVYEEQPIAEEPTEAPYEAAVESEPEFEPEVAYEAEPEIAHEAEPEFAPAAKLEFTEVPQDELAQDDEPAWPDWDEEAVEQPVQATPEADLPATAEEGWGEVPETPETIEASFDAQEEDAFEAGDAVAEPTPEFAELEQEFTAPAEAEYAGEEEEDYAEDYAGEYASLGGGSAHAPGPDHFAEGDGFAEPEHDVPPLAAGSSLLAKAGQARATVYEEEPEGSGGFDGAGFDQPGFETPGFEQGEFAGGFETGEFEPAGFETGGIPPEQAEEAGFDDDGFGYAAFDDGGFAAEEEPELIAPVSALVRPQPEPEPHGHSLRARIAVSNQNEIATSSRLLTALIKFGRLAWRMLVSVD